MVDSMRAALVAVAFVLATVILVPVQALAHTFRWDLHRHVPRRFHRIILWALGARVRVRGEPTAHRPVLFVPNHVSWTDVMVLGSLMPMSFVAKSEIAGWPVFGYLASLQRSIFVDREKRSTTGRTAQEMVERMREGDPVVLFAEGTTSDGNRVRRFRAALIGAAESMAQATGETVWLQPIALSYTRINGLPAGRTHRPRLAWVGDAELLGHAWALLKDGAMDVEVVFGNPVPFDPCYDRKTVAQFLETRVRTLHAAALRGRDDDLPT